jgi:hypothetical protein
LKHKLRVRVSITYRYSEFIQSKLCSKSIRKDSAPAPAVRFPPLDNGFVPVPTEVGGDWQPAAAPERGGRGGGSAPEPSQRNPRDAEYEWWHTNEYRAITLLHKLLGSSEWYTTNCACSRSHNNKNPFGQEAKRERRPNHLSV